MRFTLIFSLAGLLLCSGGVLLGGALGALALWVGVAFLWLATVYALDRPDWLGKRPDGRVSPLTVALFFPYFGFTWAMWHLFHRVTPEAAFDEVAPGVWLGRRPVAVQLPEAVELIVDCTGEFPVAPLAGRRVVYAPALDARAPGPAHLAAAVAAASEAPRGVYIHCAAGHGRSALVASLVLIARGLAPDLDSAERLLQRSRPAVRLHRAQRHAGEAWLAGQRRC